MTEPVVSRALAGCELVTLTALLMSLASFAPRRPPSGGDQLLPAGTGPREAFAACARFIGGGAMPDAPGTAARLPTIGAWRWTRLNDGRFRVRGYTDARSPAGERHRTYYQCDLDELSPGRWRLDSVTVSARGRS
ncbi:MAG: hypothetical protein ACM3NS_03430 [Deltaproteobacteria bacterium]